MVCFWCFSLLSGEPTNLPSGWSSGWKEHLSFKTELYTNWHSEARCLVLLKEKKIKILNWTKNPNTHDIMYSVVPNLECSRGLPVRCVINKVITFTVRACHGHIRPAKSHFPFMRQVRNFNFYAIGNIANDSYIRSCYKIIIFIWWIIWKYESYLYSTNLQDHKISVSWERFWDEIKDWFHKMTICVCFWVNCSIYVYSLSCKPYTGIGVLTTNWLKHRFACWN